MLFVSLFTARIVYNTLGIEGYGTYNLVAGIIVFFTFINNALGTATKRFVTAEIGKGEHTKIRHVFNICIQSHVIIAAIILVAAETVGLWFVNTQLNIPQELMYGANWAYQLAVAAALIGIVQSPFGAAIVAYEKMDIYALFTIIDVVMKLLIVYAVQAIAGDKLVIYSSLLFMVTIVHLLINQIYVYKKIPTCRLQRVQDKKLLKEIFSFTSWSLLGQAAVVATNQGVSVLVNIYYGVLLNAAMGVSNTITNTVNGFVSNFQVAFNPQIIKSYHNGEHQYLQNLLVRASKLSSFLIIIFLVPLWFEAPKVLQLWLGNYPQYSVEFSLLTLGCIYIEAIAAPLWMLVYSQSNIKQYQIIVASVYAFNFLGGWLLLHLGAAPYSVIIVRAVVFAILLFIRLFYVKKYFAQFNVQNWLYNVIIKGVLIIATATLVTAIFARQLTLPPFPHIVVVTAISLACTLPLIYLFGMNKGEQQFVRETVLKNMKFKS